MSSWARLAASNVDVPTSGTPNPPKGATGSAAPAGGTWGRSQQSPGSGSSPSSVPIARKETPEEYRRRQQEKEKQAYLRKLEKEVRKDSFSLEKNKMNDVCTCDIITCTDIGILSTATGL